MHRLLTKKILLVMAIWLLTGGLALADTFDLSDEFQPLVFDRACAIEAGLDEVREPVADALSSVTIRDAELALQRTVFKVTPCSDLLRLCIMQPLPETLKTFRI